LSSDARLGHLKKVSFTLKKYRKMLDAQCLEYDIAAQGSTIRDAIFEFQRTFVAELTVCASNGQSLEEIDAAPNYYWKLFERAGAPLRDDPIPPFRFPDALPPRLILPTYRQLRVA